MLEKPRAWHSSPDLLWPDAMAFDRQYLVQMSCAEGHRREETARLSRAEARRLVLGARGSFESGRCDPCASRILPQRW